MANKQDKTGHSKGEKPHARLYAWMEKEDAWRALSGNAVKTWLVFNLIYNGRNNGRLALSVRDLGKRIGVGRASAARAILELVEAGFVRIEQASSFSQRRLAAEYRLTHFDNHITGEAASKDFIAGKKSA